MIELPFEMNFEFNFTNGTLSTDTKNILTDIILNISPSPKVNIFFTVANENIINFYSEIKNKVNAEITAVNPIINDDLYTLINNNIINIKITDSKQNLENLKENKYNLILYESDNLYEELKNINSNNINKITVLRNCNISYKNSKKQTELIKRDINIRQKCYLIPYLEEHEQKKYYDTKDKIRPFLTCAALWFNPVIDTEGRINLPCYITKETITETDFFELWDSNEINDIRENLINVKQFDKCKYCPKFYEDDFLVVDNGILEYNNRKFDFGNILNRIKSAPTVAIIESDNICIPIGLYSERDIQDIYNNENLLFLLK
ncbi:hypothetical protein IJ182_05830 [bacterium]|nr:hypothetical protein [bacterium]